MSLNNTTVAVVIPSYKVKKHILQVLATIPEFVDKIYVVDDRCPEGSGDYVETNTKDNRIMVLRNQENLGVGGAVCHGYSQGLKDGIDIIVKVDGDGQMDPNLILPLIQPILRQEADYVKGSRFYQPSSLEQMPAVRLIGNTALSFINKVVSGYWDIMDPTNGFTAIAKVALKEIPLAKLSSRYFFESDMLFRLSLCRAKVVDFSMDAIYGDEVSNLRISKVLIEFPPRFLQRFLKRITYLYFLRDFNFGSLSLVTGTISLFFGLLFGIMHYYEYAIVRHIPAPTGMVVIPAMLIILGTQFLISFLQHDITAYPKTSLIKKRQLHEIEQ